MHLSQLNLFQFKNYSEAEIFFDKGVNCFAGNNGSGKTNLLDAIHYLSMTKSYFTAGDIQNIMHGQTQAMIKGMFHVYNEQKEVMCVIRKEQKKVIKVNNTEYEKFAGHIGLLPVVMVSPMDHELITGGSDLRRKFVDSIISQCDSEYLLQLISYNKVLSQRNVLLKQHSRKGIVDYTQYEFYDIQLHAAGMAIYEKRKTFFEIFLTLFTDACVFMAPENEVVIMQYNASLKNFKMSEMLEANFKFDLSLEYTSGGIHKDDWEFFIDSFAVKKYGSQGQQKTLLIALKLAQYQYLQLMKNMKPILMLDDIYDKLDESRVGKLMQMVSEHKFGQIFITDTNIHRIEKIFVDMGEPLRKFHVDRGIVKSV